MADKCNIIVTNMKKQDLDRWYTLRKQVINGYHMEKSDWTELIQLNHQVMEASHKIDNDNMLRQEKPQFKAGYNFHDCEYCPKKEVEVCVECEGCYSCHLDRHNI